MASSGGLWLYELQADGSWKPIGERQALWIEILAGRDPMQIIWRGDRIYELNAGFGLLVYDVADPARPRRIAHAGGRYIAMQPLDNDLIALVSEATGLIEIHRLP